MILVRLMGGLGNQMFQYAAATALAYRHDTQVKIDLSLLGNPVDEAVDTLRMYELSAFNIQECFASEKEIKYFNPVSKSILQRIGVKLKKVVTRPQLYIQQGCGYDSAFNALADNTCIVGRFQSERYFESVKPVLQEAYTFKQFDHFQSLPDYEQIANTNSVAVHVRRGDYVKIPKYRDSLGEKGSAYYARAFEEIKKRVKHPTLFVFSDDIEWCKQNLVTDLPINYVSFDAVEEESAWRDLYLMSSCKHFIIPNSTFSWWGAWLGNHPEKQVLAPERWSNNGQLESDDRIPSCWKRI